MQGATSAFLADLVQQQTSRKATLAAYYARVALAGGTPAPTLSSDDILIGVDAETGAEIRVPISAVISAIVPFLVAPTVISSPVLTVSGDGLLLTTTTGEWTGGATIFAFQWFVFGGDWNLIDGATSQTFETGGHNGLSVRCEVTASNAAGSATQPSDEFEIPVPGEDGPPVPISPPVIEFITAVISGLPEDIVRVTEDGAWSGAQPIDFTYQWMIDFFTVIDGATDFELLAAEYVGEVITCNITATNEFGSETQPSDPITF